MILEKTNFEWEIVLSDLNSAMKNSEETVLPIRIGYKIVKNRLAIKEALKAYFVTKDAIINKYSNGRGYVSEKEDAESFEKIYKESNVISKEKTSVNIDMISIEDFKEINLSLNIISALEFMLIIS